MFSLLGISKKRLIHLSNTLVPASDDLAPADLELEGLSAIAGRVKLLSVGQGPCVVDHHSLARLGVSGA